MKPFARPFSASSKEGLLPANWVASTVIPMNKDRDMDYCGSYGSVSLISIVLKTLERGLRDRTIHLLEANSLMMVEQHDFGTNVHV